MFRQNTLKKTIDKAEKYFNKGQMYKARNMYLKALAQDPRNIGILNNLAFIYHVLGDDATSKGYNEILLKECDEILKQGAVKEILILKIPALVSLERTNEVMEVIEEILKIDSKDLNALFQKSYYLEKNKRHEEALDCIEQILKKHPYHIGTLLSKGRNLVELNRFEEAEKCYNLVFEIEPKNKAAINLKSQLLKRKYNLTLTSHDLMLKAVESFEMENFKASRDYFKKALDMSSEFDEIWFAQGELFIRTGHINDAIASFKKAFEINPTSGGIIKHKEFFRLLDRMKKINTFLGFEKKG
ncbi:tetratricopeptide repeat protein [Methanobrevibacter sp.]|uniref:tetratricopeptide repeat protein n=1 Tax=Methanobrevibacter sp. TaxID=66852 RepID=UPI002E76C1EE|nr:tetratricopeptide repeat protein [Methanobrevibacter sp.]MEE1337143.1 tetratricopeptide repeat protein [Methanobrevibacter sp.]